MYNGGSYPSSSNVLKNNLIYDSKSGDWNFTVSGGTCTSFQDCATVAHNWCTTAATGCTATGDPKFTDTTLTNYSSATLPNLALQSSSGAIDGGTYLTTATNSGSPSSTLAVDDARYFQDGTWGSDLARGVTLFPDWIAIGSVGNVVQILSIDYSTNTIRLASSVNWGIGAPVWIYKKSDGSQVLYGAAPDYGAYEYTGGGGTTSHGSCTGCSGHGTAGRGY